jgi:phosphoribosylpyrophosphate synthetase
LIYPRVRKLSRVYGLGEGRLLYYCLSSDEASYGLLKAAKLGANEAAARKVKAAYEAHLAAFFPGFALTVPRGSGRDSFMYRLWGDDRRFLPCFDNLTPLKRRHHWAARLAASGAVEVVCDVADKRVVLVDDVVTTGATLATHLVALLRAGAYATALVFAARG